MTRLASIAVLSVLLLVACGGGEPVDEATAPIRIGAIFDLTGPTSDVGTMYADGDPRLLRLAQ